MKEEIVDKELNDLKERVGSSPYHRRITIDDGTKVVGWFEKVVQVVHTYGMKTVCFTFLTVAAFIALIMFANALNNQQVIEKWLVGKEKEHAIGSDIRKEVNPKVTASMTKLLYRMGADRVSVLEMHNGKENPTSLPFIYCDMTYEETRDSVAFISEEYVDLNMSKYNFPIYLYQHRYFIGTVDDLYEVDKKLAFRLEANNVKYFGIILIRTNIDIGFLMVSYLKMPKMDEHTILAELSYYVQEIGSYLDYAKQLERK